MISADLSDPLCEMGTGVGVQGSEGGGEAGVLVSRRPGGLASAVPAPLRSALLPGDAGLPGEREPCPGTCVTCPWDSFMCFSLRASEGPHARVPKRWPCDGVPGPPCRPAEHVPAGPGGAGRNRYECVPSPSHRARSPPLILSPRRGADEGRIVGSRARGERWGDAGRPTQGTGAESARP